VIKMEIARTVEELGAIGQELGLDLQDQLAEGEFASLVRVTQGLLGADFTGVEEETVTRDGLTAFGRLLGARNLGIDTRKGRRTAIVAGLTKRAAKTLLEAYREDQRLTEIGP
jgi:hypothetical protein